MQQFIRFLTCCLLLIPCFATAKIVFVSKRSGAMDIHVMDDDGSNVQQLTSVKPLEVDVDPQWAPDGQHIAFSRDLSRGRVQDFQLFIMRPDGSDVKQLTFPPIDYGIFYTWAPDGQHIAFSGKLDQGEQIYLIDIRTMEIQQLTNFDGASVSVRSWSPDGEYIAYDHFKLNMGSNIYVMRADGSRARQFIPIWDDRLYRDDFRWSPDSKSLLYSERGIAENGKHLGSQVVIQEYNRATGRGGKKQTLTTPNNWYIHSLDWMNNGQDVLITAEERNLPVLQYDIYRYNIATDQITNLTNLPRDDYFPDWISDKMLSVSPLGKKHILWGALKK